jgi:hypothetical protein
MTRWISWVAALLLLSCLAAAQPTCDGPDAGGYSWISSRDSLGPAFQWVDISATGHTMNAYADEFCDPLSLPFPFRWYNQDFTQLWVAPVGLVSFTDGEVYGIQNCNFWPLTQAIAGAGYWDTSGGSQEMDWQDLDSMFVVQWTHMEYMFGSQATWQLALYPDQRIKLSHFRMTGEAVLGWKSGSLHTCLFAGLEPPDYTTYLISPHLGDLRPPTVELSTHGDVEVGELESYPITATVTDSSELAEVWLAWEDSDNGRDSVAMVFEGDSWRANIPARLGPGWIRYHVRAVDNSWHPNTRVTDRLTFLVQERTAVAQVFATSGLHDRVELDWSLPAGWTDPQTQLADFECGLPPDWQILTTEGGRPWELVPLEAYGLDESGANRRALAARVRADAEATYLVTGLMNLTDSSRVTLRRSLPDCEGLNTDRYVGIEIQVLINGDLINLGRWVDFYLMHSGGDPGWQSLNQLVAASEFVVPMVRLAFNPSYWSEEGWLGDDFVFLDEVRVENLVPVTPDQERAIASYNVLRDGQLLAENLQTRRWTDTSLAPGDSASYQIQAVFDSGAGPLSDPVTGRVAQGPVAGTGELSGYRWTHSDAPGGPAWEWLDMSQATVVGFGSQGLSGVRSLGFEFRYFDIPRQTVRVLSAGGLVFSDYVCGLEWTLPMPAAPLPNDWIAALFSHQLTFSAKTLELPEGSGWVAEFSQNQVPQVQVRLTPDGAIRWCFRDGTAAGEWLVGVEGPAGVLGTSIHLGRSGARLGEGVAILAELDENVDIYPPSISFAAIPDQGLEESTEVLLEAEVHDSASGVEQVWFVYGFDGEALADSLAFERGDEERWQLRFPMPTEPCAVQYRLTALDGSPAANRASTATSSFQVRSVGHPVVLVTSSGLRDHVDLQWNFAWSGSARSLTGYRIRRDGELIGESVERNWVDSIQQGCPPFQLHQYTVSPVYDAGEGPDCLPATGFASVEHGPDPFGYVWATSDEGEGPAHQWEEISASGTEIPVGEDDSRGPFPIGFSFPYFGTAYTQYWVHSCGLVSFNDLGDSSSPCYSDPIPDPGTPNNFISPYWDHLDPSRGGEVYSWQDPSGQRLIIEYHEVPTSAGSTRPHTFQVVLHANGDIEMRYEEVGSYPYCTAGIEDAEGRQGQFHFKADWDDVGVLHDDLTVLYRYPPSCLEFICTGQPEVEPNQGLSQGDWNVWNGTDPICGSLESGAGDWFLMEQAGGGLDLRVGGSGADWVLLARAPEAGGWLREVDDLRTCGSEALHLEGLPAGPVLVGLRRGAAGTAPVNVYQLQLDPHGPATCTEFIDLDAVFEDQTRELPAGAHNNIDLTYLIPSLPATPGRDQLIRLVPAFSGPLTVTLTAAGIGDEVLAAFSSCDSLRDRLLGASERHGPDAAGVALELDVVAGEELWLLADLTQRGRAEAMELSLQQGTHVEERAAPVTFTLLGNYPNPFNPATRIRWVQPEAAAVRLRVWNLAGQQVAELDAGRRGPGQQELNWEATGLASGSYYYRLDVGGWSAHGSMLLVR